MIVEDDDDLRSLLAQATRRHGLEVSTAATVAEAQKHQADSSFDVLLVDLGLPDKDGFALATWVRATFQGRPPWLVAMTGFGQPADRRRCSAAGFDEHLIKPVAMDKLVEVLTNVGNRPVME